MGFELASLGKDHRVQKATSVRRPPSGNLLQTNPFSTEREQDSSAPQSQDALGRLMRAEDLSVVFQPIVRMANMRVFAYEALSRCSLPAFSNPAVLFDKASEDGCCGRLGRTVREAAIPLCEGIPIFLNVHPRELEERWLVRPDDPIYFHDAPVYLEITEAVPLSHFDLCKKVIRDIQARSDVRLVVDDLGAGYSNLKHIADLEPAVVKLDRALVFDISKDPRRLTLVGCIVNMCERLGAQVVAEGIETPSELDALRELGVHYCQGFLFAKPGFPLPLRDMLETRPGVDAER